MDLEEQCKQLGSHGRTLGRTESWEGLCFRKLTLLAEGEAISPELLRMACSKITNALVSEAKGITR